MGANFILSQVIMSTSDKAGANLRLISMQTEHGYRTKNLYAEDRYLYFMSDVPHLLKTIRNNFESSKSYPSATRHLWVSFYMTMQCSCILFSPSQLYRTIPSHLKMTNKRVKASSGITSCTSTKRNGEGT